jgi:hypothetical protein
MLEFSSVIVPPIVAAPSELNPPGNTNPDVDRNSICPHSATVYGENAKSAGAGSRNGGAGVDPDYATTAGLDSVGINQIVPPLIASIAGWLLELVE